MLETRYSRGLDKKDLGSWTDKILGVGRISCHDSYLGRLSARMLSTLVECSVAYTAVQNRNSLPRFIFARWPQ